MSTSSPKPAVDPRPRARCGRTARSDRRRACCPPHRSPRRAGRCRSVGGVPPAELGPVQQDGARIPGVVAPDEPDIAGGGPRCPAGRTRRTAPAAVRAARPAGRPARRASADRAARAPAWAACRRSAAAHRTRPTRPGGGARCGDARPVTPSSSGTVTGARLSVIQRSWLKICMARASPCRSFNAVSSARLSISLLASESGWPWCPRTPSPRHRRSSPTAGIPGR